jgi:hypothetical protein
MEIRGYIDGGRTGNSKNFCHDVIEGTQFLCFRKADGLSLNEHKKFKSMVIQQRK